MNDIKWSGKSQNISYNNWLREEAKDSRSIFRENMGRLQVQLQVLESVICLEEITTERLERALQAVNHLLTELHLLVILTEEK